LVLCGAPKARLNGAHRSLLFVSPAQVGWYIVWPLPPTFFPATSTLFLHSISILAISQARICFFLDAGRLSSIHYPILHFTSPYFEMAGPSSPELDWFDLAQTIGIDDVDSLGLPHIPLPGFLDDFALPPVSAGAGTVTPTGYIAPQDDMHVPVPASNLFSPTLPENLLPQLAPMPPPRPLRILPEDQIMDIRKHLTHILTKHSFSVADKEKIIGSFPDGILNNFMHIIKPRDPAMLPSPSPPGSPARSEHDSQRTLSPFEGEPHLNEDNYTPKEQHDHSFVEPNAPQPVYPMFVGHFKSGSEARKFRKRVRYPPKTNASDVQRVKRYGRTSSLFLLFDNAFH
jgi:hypothetical protein